MARLSTLRKEAALKRNYRSKKISLWVWLFFFSFAWQSAAQPAQGAKTEEFSFVVFGDSRLPGYIPYTATEADAIKKLLDETLRYAYGTSQGFTSDIRFDPKTGELESIKVTPPGGGMSETQFFRDGWPRLMIAGEGSNARIKMRFEGQDWVFRRVIEELRRGARDPSAGPSFCLHNGDITYSGLQGKNLQDSPFWQDFHDRFLAKLPPGGPRNLPGRFFPAVGNHETWGDENLEGFMSSMPYLAKLGLSPQHRVYKFDFKGCRFIFLDTGDLDVRHQDLWLSRYPDFRGQMALLEKWLKEAKEKKLRRVFITFHAPVFTLAGVPLAQDQSPHRYLKSFASDLEITVFTGHVHQTEIYVADGIRYLLLGGGGGEQDLVMAPPPAGHPRELYWQGQPPVEDYNYLTVHVGKQGLRFRIHRFRPTSEKLFETVEVLPKDTPTR